MLVKWFDKCSGRNAAVVWLTVLVGLGIGGHALADPVITKLQQQELYHELVRKPQATVTDAGDYLVVQSPTTSQLVAFTKAWHPADPGIVELTLQIKDGGLFVRSRGFHGVERENEFDAFHARINATLIPIVKESMVPLEGQYDPVEFER